MFEILFLAFAITMLLRWPEDVRRMRERKRSALPSGPEYQISGDAADRAPHRRKTAGEFRPSIALRRPVRRSNADSHDLRCGRGGR
jgi:hypothetical protein